MENLHPQLAIEVATLAHQERIASALALATAAVHGTPGPSPRAALASALLALAERVSPGASTRHASALA